MIEIGTGYFVEQTPEKAKEFCARKMEMIKENMDKIGSAINSRRTTLEMIGQTYHKKLAAAQGQASASGAKK
jgi:prefoldin subunit 5